MLLCEIFPLILQMFLSINVKNEHITMASQRKKTGMKGSQSKTTLLEALGMKRITDLFHNERLHFFLGMVLAEEDVL